MNYRYLGNSGLKVSELCIGTMTFGSPGKVNEIGQITQQEADILTNIAIDAGINFFDTADVYSGGVSEEVLGKSLGKRRKDVIVATKIRFPMSNNINDTGLSRFHIIDSCERSLKRLGTDYIDLYQIHGFDPGTPVEETLRALETLVQSGKIRYTGCSNLNAWQTMKALAISEKLNLEKFVTNQLYYSIGARDIEQEIVPMCLDQKMGILCWSPLSGGFFTGKYSRENHAPTDSRRGYEVNLSLKYWPVNMENAFEILDVIAGIAASRNKTIAQVAINWLLKKPAVTSVILGIRKPSQLTENIGACGWNLSPEEMQKLDAVSAQPVMYPAWHQMYADER